MLEGPSPEKKLSRWVRLALRLVDAQYLSKSVNGEIDGFVWLTNELHFCSTVARPLWILAFRLFWNEFEALWDPNEMLKVLRSRKDCYPIVSTPKGMAWLNKFTVQMYYFLRLYTYGGSCIICARQLDACNDQWLKLDMPNIYAHPECYVAFKQMLKVHPLKQPASAK
jgi:hypothetical protein